MNAPGRTRGVRLSDVLSVTLLVGTFLLGAGAYDAVPAEMLIHYTPPGSVYYGLERVPKELGLFIVPVVGSIMFCAARLLSLVGDVNEEMASVRPYYHAGLVLLVTFLGGVQVLLVALNIL